MKQLMNSIFGKERLGYAEALFAGLMRLVPHPANFTPAGGLAVYSGARLSGWRAFATPLVMLVVTGLVLAYAGGYSFWSMTTLFVMASFCVYVLLGRLVRNTENPLAIGGVTFAGSVQFFLVTNFAVWAFAGYYPMTPAGLMTSYSTTPGGFRRRRSSPLCRLGWNPGSSPPGITRTKARRSPRNSTRHTTCTRCFAALSGPRRPAGSARRSRPWTILPG